MPSPDRPAGAPTAGSTVPSTAADDGAVPHPAGASGQAGPEGPAGPAGTTAGGDLDAAARQVAVLALAEDLGDAGDLTTAACVPAAARGTADVVARAAGVVAGLGAARMVLTCHDPGVHVELRAGDGDRVTAGAVLATVRGPLRAILTAERAALNVLAHLCGIATHTARFVEAVAGTGCTIRDTRKTLPGMRLLEKAAVRAGGGRNHRTGLSDALLVKDNHAAAAGGLTTAARAALAAASGRPVQVEVADLADLDGVVALGVADVLLDNLDVGEVREAVRRVAGRVRLEASGRIDLDTVRAYAQTGVDAVAVGALTHSAPWLDVALDVRWDASGEAGAAPASGVG